MTQAWTPDVLYWTLGLGSPSESCPEVKSEGTAALKNFQYFGEHQSGENHDENLSRLDVKGH